MPKPIYLIGGDDSGRGAVAGPSVLAMVYHPKPTRLQYLGATDSKKTDKETRARFVAKLKKEAGCLLAYAAASADWISTVGNDGAEADNAGSAFMQIHQALGYPELSALHLLMDGNKHYPTLPKGLRVDYLPKGDGYQPLIAAASMVAQFVQDQLIQDLHEAYPEWGLDVSNGYITRAHSAMIYEWGPQPFHRQGPARKAAITYALEHKLPPPGWLTSPGKEP